MKRDGLTLIEVILAMLLLVIVLAVMANSQISSMQVTRDSRIASEATQLANDVVESVQQEVYQDWDTYYDCTSCDDSNMDLSDISVPEGYDYSVSIAKPNVPDGKPAFLNEGLIKVAISITGPSSLSFTSYVSCYDEQRGITLTSEGKCPEPVEPQ